MFLLMFLQVAHVQILLVTALYLTHVFLPFFLVLEVHLYVLFEIRSGCEGLAALLADEWLFLHMDASVSVEVGLLIELLIALIEVTLIRLSPGMDQLVSF